MMPSVAQPETVVSNRNSPQDTFGVKIVLLTAGASNNAQTERSRSKLASRDSSERLALPP